MAIPLTTGREWTDVDDQWAQAITPVLNNPLLQGKLITGILLPANTPVTFNHMLGRMMVGWFVTDRNATGGVFRAKDFNTTTLTLQSSATTTISLWVF